MPSFAQPPAQQHRIDHLPPSLIFFIFLYFCFLGEKDWVAHVSRIALTCEVAAAFSLEDKTKFFLFALSPLPSCLHATCSFVLVYRYPPFRGDVFLRGERATAGFACALLALSMTIPIELAVKERKKNRIAKCQAKETSGQTSRSKDRKIEGRGIKKSLNRRRKKTKKKNFVWWTTPRTMTWACRPCDGHCPLSIYHPCFAIGIVAPLSWKEGFFWEWFGGDGGSRSSSSVGGRRS